MRMTDVRAIRSEVASGAVVPSAAGALRNSSIAIAMLVISVFFACMNPAFLSPRNLANLTVELSITTVLSLGMLLVILPGHIDLSVGSGVGLFGAIVAVLIFHHGWSAAPAMAVAAVLAVLIWLAMGTLIVRQRIPAFIITLAGLLIFKGMHWLVIANSTVPIQVGATPNLCSLLTTWFLPPNWGYGLAASVFALCTIGLLGSRGHHIRFGLQVEPFDIVVAKLIVGGQMLFLFVIVCNAYRGVPLSAIVLAAAAVIVWILTQHTRLGRYLYAIGGNEEAAFVSGVPVARVIIIAFGIMGLLTAVGGFMQTAYAGAATTTIGQLLELDAIAACVIGGASLRGGRGTVLGVIFGSLLMASLLNGMTLLAVTPEVKFIARGVVLALAVWVDTRLAPRA
jgi:D-xylose transport system permease protein